MGVQPDEAPIFDQRLWGRYAPASTGWLIVSIIFGPLWAWDATQMSLYWVARLPIKRPKATSPLAPPRRPERAVPKALDAHRRRQRKIALSLAVVGALAAPFAFRTYKAQRTSSSYVFVPLTAQQKEDFTIAVQNYRNSDVCKGWPTQPLAQMEDCSDQLERERALERGGYNEWRFDLLKYLGLNGVVAAATFIGIFVLSFLIPALVRGFAFLTRGYWKWLNT